MGKLKNVYIIILIITIFIVSLFYYYIHHSNKTSLEYSSKDSPYIHPKVIENFISLDQKNYILKESKQKFKESEILNGINNDVRKSETCWLSKNDPKLKPIFEKACKLANLPFENCEDLQVVKYDQNGYYNEHHDACCDDNEFCKKFVNRGGQRKITFVIYLNNDFTGGTTYFPNLDKHYKAPTLGALMFHTLATNTNKCHPLALHTGTKVNSGNKYIANIWIRELKFT